MGRRKTDNRLPRTVDGWREGTAIIGELERVTSRFGHRPAGVWDDWLEVSIVNLEQLPDLFRQVAQTRRLPQSEAIAAVERRVFAKYGDKAQEVAKAFYTALSILVIEASNEFNDVLGSIYMTWVGGSERAGQFFTPYSVASMMAQMTVREEAVYERLKAAIAKEPLAEALMLAAGLTGAALEHHTEATGATYGRTLFHEQILPLALPHYEPVRILDPCCGSGVMLIAAAEVLPRWMVLGGFVQFYGIDLDATCVAMARLNMLRYGLNGGSLRLTLAVADSLPHLRDLLPAGAAPGVDGTGAITEATIVAVEDLSTAANHAEATQEAIRAVVADPETVILRQRSFADLLGADAPTAVTPQAPRTRGRAAPPSATKDVQPAAESTQRPGARSRSIWEMISTDPPAPAVIAPAQAPEEVEALTADRPWVRKRAA